MVFDTASKTILFQPTHQTIIAHQHPANDVGSPKTARENQGNCSRFREKALQMVKSHLPNVFWLEISKQKETKLRQVYSISSNRYKQPIQEQN